jgi:hypothetical protein
MQLEIGRGKFLRHDLVDQILDPLLGRLEAFLVSLRRAPSLTLPRKRGRVREGAGAVHRLGGPLRRPAERNCAPNFLKRHHLFGKPASTFPDDA